MIIMQFLAENRHIIIEVSPQMPSYTYQKFYFIFLWGAVGPDL